MSHDPTEDLAGIPVMAPPTKSSSDSSTRPLPRDPAGGRNPFDEAVPIGSPSSATPVPPAEQAQRDAKQAMDEQERQFREILRAESEHNKGLVTRVLRKLTVAFVLIVAGLGGLLLWTQVIQSLRVIAVWSFYPWLAAVIILASAFMLIAVSVGRLLWLSLIHI